jgi:hypothetical protein
VLDVMSALKDKMVEEKKNLFGQPLGSHRILGVLPFFTPTHHPGKCVKQICAGSFGSHATKPKNCAKKKNLCTRS